MLRKEDNIFHYCSPAQLAEVKRVLQTGLTREERWQRARLAALKAKYNTTTQHYDKSQDRP